MSDSALAENMRIMNDIVREMKEIPELPSEQPKDNAALLKVEFPDKGGVLTFIEGHEFPYRGFPYFEFVEKIDYIKKTSRAFLSGLYHGLKNKKLWLITLVPAFWMAPIIVRVGVYVFSRMIDRFKIKEERYSQAVRELNRVLSIPVGKDTTFQYQFRNLVCGILEFDNAYRFRFQDIIEELDKKAIRKNPAKELVRLFSLMQGREIGQDTKDTLTLFKLFVSFYLRFDGEMRKILANLAEIDINLAKLTSEDKWYCPSRSDYTCAFITRVEKLSDEELKEDQKLDQFIVKCSRAWKVCSDERAAVNWRYSQAQQTLALENSEEKKKIEEAKEEERPLLLEELTKRQEPRQLEVVERYEKQLKDLADNYEKTKEELKAKYLHVSN